MNKQTWGERFDEEFVRDDGIIGTYMNKPKYNSILHVMESKNPFKARYALIEKLVDCIVGNAVKEERKRIIKYLYENLDCGESWERGDVYLEIGEAKTNTFYKEDDDFWRDVEKELTK